MILGLTGGFAAGKSTVARLLAERGFAVYSADAEVHRLLADPGPAREEVAAAFPEQCPGGVPDRAALASLVFAEPAALSRLEAILHPFVRRELLSEIHGARDLGADLVCEIPLLVESGLEGLFDAVWTVEASAESRRERADRIPEAAFEARESRFAGRDARAAAADEVLSNDGTEADLAASVDALLAA